MFHGPGGKLLLEPWHLGLAVTALILAVLEEQKEWFEGLSRAPVVAYASAMALMFLCIEIFGVIDTAIPFIYFQF
jgi:hypothetical protein